jgi:hypothetical protein
MCPLYKEQEDAVRPRLVFFIMTGCLFYFIGCPAGNSRTDSGLPPAEQSPQILSTDTCQAAKILPQVESLLDGFTMESHYLIIRNQLVLSIWLVMPELNAYASKEEVDANSRLAFVRGVRICHNIASQIPCVQYVFDAINPMIVDEKYNCWYRDIIPMQNLLTGQNSSDNELIQAVTRRDMKYSYRRTVPPRTEDYADIISIPAWKEFRTSIQQILCDAGGRCNVAAYPMFLSDYCIVQVYWEALSDRDLEDAYVLERMSQIAQAFSKISLPIARLDMSVVKNDGKLSVYGKVDGHAFRSLADSLMLKNEIRLYHMP